LESSAAEHNRVLSRFGGQNGNEVDGEMEKQLQGKLYIGVKRRAKIHVI
jgi:hypothetical protein